MPLPGTTPELPSLSERLRTLTELLESIGVNRRLLDALPSEARERFHRALAEVYPPDAAARRRMTKAAARERRAAAARRDDGVLHETGIRSLRRKPVVNTPNVFPPAGFEPHDLGPGEDEVPAQGEAVGPRHCYVCKENYSVIHHFYDQLCPPCAAVNFGKRTELADLRGRVALLTGGRVKIGYQAGLKLLRCGAQLIVTTRFPARFGERDTRASRTSTSGAHRLEIFGLDLRHTPSVEAFCRELLATRTGSTSSSTTRVRPSAGRRISTRT